MNDVLTHRKGEEPIAYKYCKCNSCNIIAKCTSGFDFYTLSTENSLEDGSKPLYCYSCMLSESNKISKIKNKK